MSPGDLAFSTCRLVVPQWLHHLKSNEVLPVKVPILNAHLVVVPQGMPRGGENGSWECWQQEGQQPIHLGFVVIAICKADGT